MTSTQQHQSGRLLLLAAAAILIPATVVSAQLSHKGPAQTIALAATLPPYDVVSVKINHSGEQSWNINTHDDRLIIHNVPLKSILEFTYDIHQDLIFGITGPVADANFDIEAKVVPPDGAPPRKLSDRQLTAMIIPLLADRFHLKAHLATRTLPVYDLVVAHSGLKIKLDHTERTGGGWNLNGQNTEVVLSGKSDTLADLASAIADPVGRKVIDKTGLTGAADITLRWTDDVDAQQGGPNVISIFTALEEQLGLKLQPSKGPVDTLVIDHVEMPTEN
jgi:uncharacterized protein (TIGR03435 family)